jgi:hypothetical protein
MPALARQDISAGNPMQMKDTYENPLGDGGLRGDPDGTEGTPKKNLPDIQDQVSTDATMLPRDFPKTRTAPTLFERVEELLRSLQSRIQRASK